MLRLVLSGLPQGQEKSINQEKSGKTKKKKTKVRRSQEKMGVFEKKSGNLTKFKKMSDFVSLNFQNSLNSKAFK